MALSAFLSKLCHPRDRAMRAARPLSLKLGGRA